jgi:crossover junction endodeoxyribonuclease RuvC
MQVITLGIDPGTALLGFGVVESEGDPSLVEFGVIETKIDRSMPQRLVSLYDRIVELLARHRPDVLAIEQLFFARNVTTAIAVGQARGVVLLAAAKANVAVVEYSPSEVKHAVVGYGKADKAQMQEMVRIILGLEEPPRPDDAADALAVALCHVHRSAFEAKAAGVASDWM